jgi:hypothetical protein
MISEHFSIGYLDATVDILYEFEREFYFYSVAEEQDFFNMIDGCYFE